MTKFKFEDLSKKTVAQLRKIAEGVEHETLQDPTKMPKGELLAALCQALGIEAGEAPEETVQDKEPVTQDSDAAEASEKKVEDEKPAAQESEPAEPPEESPKEEPAAVQEDTAAEPPKESAKEESAAVQEDAPSEPALEGTKEGEPPSAEEKKAPAQESTPTESPEVVNKGKGKLKLQIRELKSQRNTALDTHDHVLLKSIRRRIRTLKRKVRRLAA